MTNKRILYWDIIKFFAIFCVVYGHAIQNLNSPNRSLWDSPMENYIISFHMPLFMIVSGYFARTITKLRIHEIIKKKFRQFIIPSVTTYFLTGIILIFLRHTPFIEGLQSLFRILRIFLLVSKSTIYILCTNHNSLSFMEENKMASCHLYNIAFITTCQNLRLCTLY